MDEQRLTELIEKYLDGTCTSVEKALVEQWYESFDAHDIKFYAGDKEKIDRSAARSLEALKQKMAEAQEEKGKVIPMRAKRKGGPWRYVAAAIIIIAAGTAGYFFFSGKQQINTPAVASKEMKHDALPGGNKATLTLADGSVIVLDTTANGDLAQQGNTKVIKLDSGMLAYNAGNANTSEVLYNTITTPRGGQYQVRLPDGSKVWLNAASSLRFPTAFTRNERDVTLTGEGYFEVVHNPAKPFHVITGSTQVEVLGTHFNIMAYGDENLIKTTLLEGSVKVTSASNTILLQPGQQANVNKNGSIKLLPNVDTDKAVGWKDGLFKLDQTDIPEIMRQIARWYDVEIVYEGAIPGGSISGDISRNMNLSKVLKVLELSGVHCRIDNKKIYVAP
ncbi:MAG: FecR domain-containing protein [Bacteroidetes bacterium]|nr:FecR domain-containing protein [Bacteroidota bacterium]